MEITMENQIKFHGRGGEFFGIWIVNLLLSVVTLGIYSAWAKVRTKKYFYGNTELAGDRFDYHGQPIQILKGRIVAMICLVVWGVSNNLFPILSVILLFGFIAIMPWLVRSNACFDARMTSFRNVHFDFVGTLKGAYSVFLLWPLLCYILFFCCFILVSFLSAFSMIVGVVGAFLTIGLGFVLFSWVSVKSASYFVNGYRFGNHAFSAQLETKKYIVTYLLGGLIGAGMMAVMMAIAMVFGGVAVIQMIAESNSAGISPQMGASLGFMMVFTYLGVFLTVMTVNGFIQARIRNYLFSQIKINGDTEYGMSSTMTATGLLALILTNFLLLIVTLGFAHPWVKVRSSRYVASVTAVKGDLTALTVQGDDVDPASAVADEVAQAFDLNLGIG